MRPSDEYRYIARRFGFYDTIVPESAGPMSALLVGHFGIPDRVVKRENGRAPSNTEEQYRQAAIQLRPPDGVQFHSLENGANVGTKTDLASKGLLLKKTRITNSRRDTCRTGLLSCFNRRRRDWGLIVKIGWNLNPKRFKKLF